MAHGNVYPAERIDAALGNYFRAGNLGALRELALLWVADRVDEALDEYRRLHGIERPWETRERVLVALTGARRRRPARPPRRPDGAAREGRPRRGARATAGRARVRRGARRSRASGRSSSASGGTYRDVVGDDIGKALVDTARRMNATQIVLGATRRSRLTELLRGSVIGRVIRDSGEDIDVHVISHARRRPTSGAGPPAADGTARPPRRSPERSPPRCSCRR